VRFSTTVIAFLFPGQGSQYPGMLHELPLHPVIVRVLDEASDYLGQSIFDIDSEKALTSPVPVQLALLVVGVAGFRALKADGAMPDFVAGLSVGAFGAGVAAGVLSFRDAFRLVKLRAELMEQAYPQGYGMAAILGLDEHTVRQIIGREVPNGTLYIANINAPLQIIVSGADDAIEVAMTKARNAGARKVQRLQVQSPSHSPLLESVANELASAIKSTPLSPPRVPYVSNRGGRLLTDQSSIAEDLATSVAHAVRWHDATSVLFESGVRLYIEMPPGRVLTDLAAEAFPDARAVSSSGTRFGSVVALIKRYSGKRPASS
jgi:malonate decarboxylase epsilon subunit